MRMTKRCGSRLVGYLVNTSDQSPVGVRDRRLWVFGRPLLQRLAVLQVSKQRRRSLAAKRWKKLDRPLSSQSIMYARSHDGGKFDEEQGNGYLLLLVRTKSIASNQQ